MRILAAARPFILRFPASGAVFPLTSAEAQRLLDSEPYHTIRAGRIVFPAYAGQDGAVLQPATAGGGPAFTRETNIAGPGQGGR